MTPLDYILDSALVLIVILQLKERVLTTRSMLRPLVIVSIAVVSYFKTFPTAGNDIPLVLAIATVGAAIGVASGLTVKMRTNPDGEVTARAGVASAVLWVAGMGSRFAFIFWLTHSGASSIAHFSAAHHITSGQAWTVALLSMAVAEVLGRTIVMAVRRNQLQISPARAVLA